MRAVGFALVVFGALILGSQAFGLVGRASASGSSATAEVEPGNAKKTGWVSPVLGGIALVGGLIVLATHGRRESLN